MHAGVIVAFIAACAACIVLARHAAPRRRQAVERVVGWASLALFAAVNQELWLRRREFDWGDSLPLHVCDLALLAVLPAMAWSWRPARVVLYYFGLGLSTQGFFTPDLDEGPARWPFWSFWLLHFGVVGTAVYDLAARGFRPTWRDFALAAGVALAYGGLVVPLDVMFGVNYGYVGPTKPQKPTLIDALGPWPARVFVIVGLTMVVFAMMTLPWQFARRRGSQPRDLAAAGVSPEESP